MRKSLCQIFVALENQNGIGGKQDLKKNTMVACTRMTSNKRYGGMGLHATKRTVRWHGNTNVPLTLGIMVACISTPPLCLE
jgi:hypothetical protein